MIFEQRPEKREGERERRKFMSDCVPDQAAHTKFLRQDRADDVTFKSLELGTMRSSGLRLSLDKSKEARIWPR